MRLLSRRRAFPHTPAALAVAVAGLKGRTAEGQLSPAPSPLPAGDGGAFTDCPCIDHHSGTQPEWLAVLSASGLVANDSLVLANSLHFPRAYGSGNCRAWDADGRGAPECKFFGATASWCALSWCYVDLQNCHPRRRPRPSAYFESMHYSYATCGSIDAYFVGESYWGSRLLLCVYAFDSQVSMAVTGREAGWRTLVMFTYQVLQMLQLPTDGIEYRSLSPASRELYSSDYSACVHDVALGHLDLCVGDFWDTPERRAKKVIFSPIYSEWIYLHTTVAPRKLAVWEYLYQPLRPFSMSLWMLIFTVIPASGVFLAVLEYEGPLAGLVRRPTLRSTGWSMYLSILSFLDAGVLVVHRPHTYGGKVFAVGLAFFACVVFASFTASTASFLIFKSRDHAVESLEEAIAEGMQICILESLLPLFLTMHPGMDGRMTGLARGRHVLAAVSDGVCGAGIVGEPLVMDAHADGEYCNIQRVGRPVMSFPTGVFMSERLQHAFNWGAVTRRYDGTWANLRTRIYPSSTCPDEITDWSEPSQLEAHHMLGNCGLLLLCFMMSAFLMLLHRMERSQPVQQVEEGVIRTISRVHERVTSPKGTPPNSPRQSRGLRILGLSSEFSSLSSAGIGQIFGTSTAFEEESSTPQLARTSGDVSSDSGGTWPPVRQRQLCPKLSL